MSDTDSGSSTAVATKIEPILRGRDLVKTFGHVVGLNGADIDLYPGEVLAVIGDNGAGKSTLIKCFSGAHRPDSGTMEVDGEEVEFGSTHESREAGIETVFQTLAVSPARAVLVSTDGPRLNTALRATARLHLVLAVLLAVGLAA